MGEEHLSLELLETRASKALSVVFRLVGLVSSRFCDGSPRPQPFRPCTRGIRGSTDASPPCLIGYGITLPPVCFESFQGPTAKRLFPMYWRESEMLRPM